MVVPRGWLIFALPKFAGRIYQGVAKDTAPAKAPYVPPDFVFSLVEENETNTNEETQGEQPGLGSGDGRWIQPPRND